MGSLRQNEEPATGASWGKWGAALTAGKVTRPGLSQQIFPVADAPEVRPVCHQMKATQLGALAEYATLWRKLVITVNFLWCIFFSDQYTLKFI